MTNTPLQLWRACALHTAASRISLIFPESLLRGLSIGFLDVCLFLLRNFPREGFRGKTSKLRFPQSMRLWAWNMQLFDRRGGIEMLRAKTECMFLGQSTISRKPPQIWNSIFSRKV